MKQLTLKLSGMTCPSCMTKIESAVGAVDGVHDTKVLFNAGKVKAHMDPLTDPQTVINTVEGLGYLVEKFSVKDE